MLAYDEEDEEEDEEEGVGGGISAKFRRQDIESISRFEREDSAVRLTSPHEVHEVTSPRRGLVTAEKFSLSVLSGRRRGTQLLQRAEKKKGKNIYISFGCVARSRWQQQIR